MKEKYTKPLWKPDFGSSVTIQIQMEKKESFNDFEPWECLTVFA